MLAVQGLASNGNNGNTLTKVTGSNTTSYAWDYENRMSSVTLPGTGGTVTFKYDPFGRRIYKSSSSTTSVYAYFSSVRVSSRPPRKSYWRSYCLYL
jgi:YD repeat-containing protein